MLKSIQKSIILDINLPDGIGFDLLVEVQKKKEDTGVVIVSARNSLDDRLKGLDLGSDDYLTKPFHLSELNSRVKAVIRRKNYHAVNELVINEIKVDFNSKTIFIKAVNARILCFLPKILKIQIKLL